MVVIYSRKSRADEEHQAAEDVLEKHESMLQEYAMRHYGHRVEEIYREVVSGDSIRARPQMQALLRRIESPEIDGVLCVDLARLSRGESNDSGRILHSFKTAGVKIITLQRTYDLSIETDYDLAEMQFLFSSKYLKYYKAVMRRGRNLSVQRGVPVQKPPYGYERCKVEKKPSFKIVESEAYIVRKMYEMYDQGFGTAEIARWATENGKKITPDSVRRILHNVAYCGIVRQGLRITVPELRNGQDIIRHRKQPQSEWTVAEGNFPAIVDKDLFDRVQVKLATNPKNQGGTELVNPLSGLVRCAKCGRVLIYRRYKKVPYLVCKAQKQCRSRNLNFQVLYDRVIEELNAEIGSMRINLGGAVDSRKTEEDIKRIQKLLTENEETQIEVCKYLEKKLYTEELFSRRMSELQAEHETLQRQLAELQAAIPREVQEDDIVLVETVLQTMQSSLPPSDCNEILRAAIQRIDVISDQTADMNRRIPVEYDLRIKMLF